MMTREQLLDELRRVSPADRAKVMVMAQTIRAARDAGDTRPAKVVASLLLATLARKHIH